MALTTTLSSAGTATIALNPVSKSTTVIVSASIASSVISPITVEMTLDEFGATPAPTAVWAPLSSAILGSSTTSGTALSYTVLSPIGGVRLNSSGQAGSSAVWTLKALQSVTA